jgi:hypothetical protein
MPIVLSLRFGTFANASVYLAASMNMWSREALRYADADDDPICRKTCVVPASNRSSVEVGRGVHMIRDGLSNALERSVRVCRRETREAARHRVGFRGFRDPNKEPAAIRVGERGDRLRDRARIWQVALILDVPSLSSLAQALKVDGFEVVERRFERRKQANLLFCEYERYAICSR